MQEKIRAHKVVAALFFISLLFVFGGTAWSYVALRGLKTPLVVGFNGGAGIELGSLKHLLAVGATALVITVINFIIALELDARDRFLGKLLAATTLVLASLLFIGFTAIISVN